MHTLRLLLFIALAGLLPACRHLAAQDREPREYSIVLVGNVIGERIVERLGPQQWRYRYRFDDRGRGPELVTLVRTDEQAIPVSVRTTGVDYFKNPVDERLDVEDGVARWRNANENGNALAGGVYLSLEGAEGMDVLLRALLADPDRRVTVLPGGEAHLRPVLEHTVAIGDRKQALRLYALDGLGFSPSLLWLDAYDHLFYDGWAIRKGWEPAARELDEIRTRAVAEHLGKLARQLARTHGEPLLITNAAVFDTQTRTAQADMDVLVRDGRIARVGKDLAAEGATVVDAQGRFLMPGLWDMHVHNFGGDAVGLEHLANGVTTVRDMAADIDTLTALRERWHSGQTLGPRVVMAGFIDGPGPYAGPTKVLVDTEQAARAAVADYAKRGYEQIKLYNSLRKELVPAIIDEARKHKLRVSGHIPLHMLAEEAAVAGYDEIQHINHLFLNFMDRGIDNRTPARFVEVAKHGAELDLASEPVQRFVRLLADNDVAVDPTLAIFEADWVSRPGEIVKPMAPLAECLPPLARRSSLWAGLPVPEGYDQRYRESFRRSQEFVKVLHDAGVRVVAGTDFMPGFALHRELELYAESGIANADVLYLATAGAAELMGHADSGRIAAGLRADFILVDGDPLQDMTHIRRVEWVVRDGRLYRGTDLLHALGIRVSDSSSARCNDGDFLTDARGR